MPACALCHCRNFARRVVSRWPQSALVVFVQVNLRRGHVTNLEYRDGGAYLQLVLDFFVHAKELFDTGVPAQELLVTAAAVGRAQMAVHSLASVLADQKNEAHRVQFSLHLRKLHGLVSLSTNSERW